MAGRSADTSVAVDCSAIISGNVSRGASIGHHTRVADFASIGPGAHIAGQSVIGRGTTIGIGAVVFDHIAIGADCLIGGGSVVTKDVPDGVVAYGNPCRVIRKREAGPA